MNQKLYEKLEISIEPMLKSIGMSSFSLILFYNGKMIDRSSCISQISGIKEGDVLYASECLGKPSVFKRFREPSNTWYWCNNGQSSDGIIFVPSQGVKVCGFT